MKARANADAITQLKEELRIAERMVDAIYDLSAANGPPDRKTLLYWSVRAKAALRNAKGIVERAGPDALDQDEG